MRAARLPGWVPYRHLAEGHFETEWRAPHRGKQLLQQSERGGFLNVHADFLAHSKVRTGVAVAALWVPAFVLGRWLYST